MHYPARRGARERHTLCISSQAGCAVGCPFCATGELGFGRDLQTAEIVDQVRHASRRLIADRPAADQHRVHGHGRAAAQPGPRPGRHRGAQRPAPVRPRRAAHHGLDLGRRAGDPPAHGARTAVHPGRLAPRRPRSAAGRARAAQPPLAGRRGRRRRARSRPRDRPADQLRSDDDLWRERHRPRRRGDGRPPPRRPRPRQPDPDEPGRPHALDGQPDAGHRALRRHARSGGDPDDDPAQSRPGSRGGLRPARRRAGRGAAGAGRRAPSVAAHRRERRRVARRAQPRSRSRPGSED